MNKPLPIPTSISRYNVRRYGIKPGTDMTYATANNVALLSLIGTVKAAGGGTILFPPGDYYFNITYNPGGGSPVNRSIYLSNQGKMNICFEGENGARLVWGGDAGQGGAGGGAAHFFYIRGQTSHVKFKNLHILQHDLLNPDPGAEQHHLVRVQADIGGNTQHIDFDNCFFGLVKGDAINCSGGFATNSMKDGVLGSAGSGAIGGLNNTSPAGLLPGEGQRVCVEFSGTWDGGSFTFAGTEPNGRPITETITKLNPGGDTVAGYREFATITSITKNAGGTAGTANLGWTYAAQYVNIRNNKFSGFYYAGSAPGYGYRSAIGVQRLSANIRVVGNWMTGSDDQLLDFEPTGNGWLGPWTIEGNTFVCVAAAPYSVPGTGGSDTAASFFGNANKFPCERSSFSRNVCIGGGVLGGKLKGVDIVNNYIWVPEDARLLLQFTDRMEDVRIEENWIEALGPNIGDVTAPCISMIGGGSATVPDSPENVIIARNICHWFALASPNQQPAIRITAGNNVRVEDNILCNHGTAAAVDGSVIKIEDAAKTVDNMSIDRNQIKANLGGGSIQRGIDIPTRPTTAWTNLTVCNNRGVGVTVKGVNIRHPNGGSYVNPPSVYGNRFPGATNNVVIGDGPGNGVILMMGGNGGDSPGQYFGMATDPATDTDLDNVGIGSTYQSGGAGGDSYIKTAAGSAGWKKVTHA